MHTMILSKVVLDNLKACLRFVLMYAKWIPSIDYWNTIVQINEMTRYQVPREETSINLTNISEQVY